jgi:putative membrane protein
MSLEIFGFRALWSPFLLITVLLVMAGFFLITIKYRYLFKHSEPLTKSKAILFIVAMALFYGVKGGPIDLMGHLMFYAHMIQMSILLFIIPPLLIISIPDWIWKRFWSMTIFKRIFGILRKPLVVLILFNATFSLYHVPLVFDLIKTNMILHELYTGLLILLALGMWWPLVNKIETYKSLTGLKKVAYIFASGALILPACALIIFNDSPMYASYSNPEIWAQSLALCVPSATLSSLDLSGPEMFTSMSLIHDQQLGGVLMKVIQEIVYGYVLSRVFVEWYKKDQQEAEEQRAGLYHPQIVE